MSGELPSPQQVAYGALHNCCAFSCLSLCVSWGLGVGGREPAQVPSAHWALTCMKLPGCCTIESGLRAWCRELRFERCLDGFPLPLLLLQIYLALAACLQVWVGPLKEVPHHSCEPYTSSAAPSPVTQHRTGGLHPPARAGRCFAVHMTCGNGRASASPRSLGLSSSCACAALSALVTMPHPLLPCRCKELWMWKQRLPRQLSSWMSKSGT